MTKKRKLILFLQPFSLLVLITFLLIWWHEMVVIALNFLSNNIFNNNYGLTIIFFTIFLKTLFLPFSLKNDISNKKRALLQPRVNQIKEHYEEEIKKHEDDKTYVNDLKIYMDGDIKKLYKDYSIKNLSLSGCFLLILQIIMFIGFYRAIVKIPGIDGKDFLWFELGTYDQYYILPIVLFVSMLSFFLLSNTSGKLGLIIYISLSILIGIIFIKADTALALYFITVNLFSIVQVVVAKLIAKVDVKKIENKADILPN